MLVGAGVLARDELRRAWWRLPGMAKPRKEGELDHPGAEWTAASRANWRLADRPDDYGIDMVVIHVVQGSYPTALKVFKDPGHGAAAHYVVRKDGHVAQMIRELDVAFHAGNRVVQRTQHRHRARGLRGPPARLHGRDVRLVRAAHGRDMRAVRQSSSRIICVTRPSLRTM